MSLEEKLELKKKVDNVKEPWPKEDKDDCDSAEEFASDGRYHCGVCRLKFE